MRLLVMGGTRFVGRHLVAEALERGHAVTLFNRGVSEPGLFPGVEEIHGDRDGGLAPLEGRSWDVVVDTCGYVPRVVGASAQLLAGATGHYTFISSLSVYPVGTPPGADETAPVGTIEDPTVETIDENTYGPLKVLCEREVQERFDDRALIVRAGLIVGPHDYTDRLPYWVRRLRRGGRFLAPAPQDHRVQMVDARDLGAWILDMAEAGRGGVYNATGPDRVLTIRELLETCGEATGSDAEPVWVDAAFLLERGVEPWSDVPLWLPGEEYEGFVAVSVDRAVSSGLSFRPLIETLRDTDRWDRGREEDELKAGLSSERERELLREWAEAA